MSLPKLFLTISLSIFLFIGGLAFVKRGRLSEEGRSETPPILALQEVDLALLLKTKDGFEKKQLLTQTELPDETSVEATCEQCVVIEHDDEPEKVLSLFEKNTSCPIVETVTYKSHVSWKPHKSAWLIDYANYYKTPLSFIFKSLTGSFDGKKSSIGDGQKFNVFRNDIDFHFHAVVCLSNCSMRLYYVLRDAKRAVFLKSYPVCLGRKDSSKSSGYLTPTGLFQLGSRVALFQPRMMGMHKGKQVELIQVFGTHWIPFERELGSCSSPAKGYGLHGTPMRRDEANGALHEDNSSIGKYESDGCIRLSLEDIKEVFAIISTRKTFVEIVPSFQKSKLLSGEI
jgi:hypothetical protein